MKKRLYITVDTECHDFNNQDRYIWGRTFDGEYWGIKKILDEGHRYGIPINFFLDIAEADRYGIDFVKNIAKTIQSYNQPIFLHLHPNYISGDDSRTYLWQYNDEEQKSILKRAHHIWNVLFPGSKCVAFRAGRYGTDAKIYKHLMNEFGEGLIDLSYGSPGGKMCHLTRNEIGIDNICKKYDGIVLFPNTTYVGLIIMGKKYTFGLDAAQTCLGEFKSVLNENTVSNIILTMHSWNFLKTWFFNKGKVYKDNAALYRFRSIVDYAQNRGFVISNLNDFEFVPNESDQIVDLCVTTGGKCRSIYYNFVRFQRMGRLSSKYFKLYALFYIGLFVFFIALIRSLI